MRKKIAVLRANALGDFIFILPALQALRNRFPESEIVLLGKKMHEVFLKNRPSPINRVIVVPPYPGVGESESFIPESNKISDFFAQMQNESFDMAFQMHGGGRNSNPFVKQLGAKFTLGFKTQDAVSLDISVPYTTYFSEILRYIELVSYVGAYTSDLHPRVQVTGEDIKEAEEIVGSYSSMLYVVIQPGASDPRRHWPVDKFARVADSLVEKGYTVFFNGVEAEMNIVQNIISKMKFEQDAINLSGQLSLAALTALLHHASLMVSNDTGPLHLAYALGTPAVGIYWAPNMVTGTPMHSSIFRPVVAWNTNCPLCGANFSEIKSGNGKCNHNTSFVAEVTTEEVLNAIEELPTLQKKAEAVLM